jgi:hypothetical protein
MYISDIIERNDRNTDQFLNRHPRASRVARPGSTA